MDPSLCVASVSQAFRLPLPSAPVYVACNIYTVIWALPATGLRKISGLITELQEAISTSRPSWPSLYKTKSTPRKSIQQDVEKGLNDENRVKDNRKSFSGGTNLIEWKGHDFLFLFDLVACTCGRAATLRVLSYTSSSFENLCQPRMIDHKIVTTETSIRVFWQHARLQDIKVWV